ncbi:MAG: amidohydrolase [Bacteroidota bacterium]
MDLKITIIQTPLHWENKEKNLEMFSKKLAAITEASDVIVLPEMFSTGFSMSPEKFAEPMGGPTVNWIKSKAKEKNCVITGSFIVEENGNYYNRLIWMRPDGTLSIYDKRHLFRMGDEHNHYSFGKGKLIVEIKGWKICPLVCYDLRFPVWSRNVKSEYDVLVYVANWPERRNHHWKTLLLARAIENQSYVVGVNRIGNDGKDISHSGDSAVIDPKGVIISKTKANEESIETVTLNYSELVEYRQVFPAALDADDFKIVE